MNILSYNNSLIIMYFMQKHIKTPNKLQVNEV